MNPVIVVLLVVLLVLILVGAPSIGFIPHNYGWGPSGALGIVLIIVLILIMLGKL